MQCEQHRRKAKAFLHSPHNLDEQEQLLQGNHTVRRPLQLPSEGHSKLFISLFSSCFLDNYQRKLHPISNTAQTSVTAQCMVWVKAGRLASFIQQEGWLGEGSMAQDARVSLPCSLKCLFDTFWEVAQQTHMAPSTLLVVWQESRGVTTEENYSWSGRGCHCLSQRHALMCSGQTLWVKSMTKKNLCRWFCNSYISDVLCFILNNRYFFSD